MAVPFQLFSCLFAFFKVSIHIAFVKRILAYQNRIICNCSKMLCYSITISNGTHCRIMIWKAYLPMWLRKWEFDAFHRFYGKAMFETLKVLMKHMPSLHQNRILTLALQITVDNKVCKFTKFTFHVIFQTQSLLYIHD